MSLFNFKGYIKFSILNVNHVSMLKNNQGPWFFLWGRIRYGLIEYVYHNVNRKTPLHF